MRPTRCPDPALHPVDLTPERRRALIAEVLTRGVRRHLSLAAQAGAFSAGRSLPNPEISSASELACLAHKSVTVTAG